MHFPPLYPAAQALPPCPEDSLFTQSLARLLAHLFTHSLSLSLIHSLTRLRGVRLFWFPVKSMTGDFIVYVAAMRRLRLTASTRQFSYCTSAVFLFSICSCRVIGLFVLAPAKYDRGRWRLQRQAPGTVVRGLHQRWDCKHSSQPVFRSGTFVLAMMSRRGCIKDWKFLLLSPWRLWSICQELYRNDLFLSFTLVRDQ